MVARHWERGDGELVFNRYRVCLEDTKVLEKDGDVCNNNESYLVPLSN